MSSYNRKAMVVGHLAASALIELASRNTVSDAEVIDVTLPSRNRKPTIVDAYDFEPEIVDPRPLNLTKRKPDYYYNDPVRRRRK